MEIGYETGQVESVEGRKEINESQRGRLNFSLTAPLNEGEPLSLTANRASLPSEQRRQAVSARKEPPAVVPTVDPTVVQNGPATAATNYGLPFALVAD